MSQLLEGSGKVASWTEGYQLSRLPLVPPHTSAFQIHKSLKKKKKQSMRLEAFPRDVKKDPREEGAPAGEVGEREPGGLSSTGHKGEPGTPSGILALPQWANPSLPASASRGPHTRAGLDSRQQH